MTGLRLGGWGFVLLVPDFGLLFDGGGLGAAHVGGQDIREFLAAFVTASASKDSPEVRLIQTCRDAATAPVEGAQLRLRGNIVVLGRLGEPASGFGFVASHRMFFISLGVEKT